MAEADEDKTLMRDEDKEQPDQVEVPDQATEIENPSTVTTKEGVTEEKDEVPTVKENIPAAEETSETPDEEAANQQEVEEEKPEIKLETAPADFRFPTTNQTRHCFTRYIEYHRCIAAKGEGAPECEKFAKYYRSLCPSEWIERWDEQRENGTFPGPL